MTYEAYRLLFIGGAIACGIMLIVTVILFILLKIPRVIGDLTGANARKAIAQIRSQNEGSGKKTYKSSAVNRERGRVTDRISPSGSLHQSPTEQTGGAMRTEKIETDLLVQQAQESMQHYAPAAETSVLDAQGVEHAPIDIPGSPGVSETSLLGAAPGGMYGQTSVLDQRDPDRFFEIEYEIRFVHSDVRIP